MKKSGPGQDNELAAGAAEMKIPCQYDNIDYGKKTKLKVRKVSHYEQGNGHKFYGSRAIVTKEELHSFTRFILREDKADITALPERIIGEIKKNIRQGAQDLAQAWKDALELVNKAYQVTNVRLPTPDEKAAWKQYTELISFGVKQLANTRGINGSWRASDVLVHEAMASASEERPIGSKRFFVEVPGERAVEVEGDSMDDIIDQLSNKLRRNGAMARVHERSKFAAIIDVVVKGVLRDQITIKQV